MNPGTRELIIATGLGLMVIVASFILACFVLLAIS